MTDLQKAAQQALEALEAETGDSWECNSYHPKIHSAITALRQALEAEQREDKNLAEAFRVELDKLSQRNYELRMEVAALKSTQKPLSVGAELFLHPRPAQQQAEPVYQMQKADGPWVDQDKQAYDYNTRILYTRPQPAQWVGLTDDDIDLDHPFIDSIRTIEAKLREKNGGVV